MVGTHREDRDLQLAFLGQLPVLVGGHGHGAVVSQPALESIELEHTQVFFKVVLSENLRDCSFALQIPLQINVLTPFQQGFWQIYKVMESAMPGAPGDIGGPRKVVRQTDSWNTTVQNSPTGDLVTVVCAIGVANPSTKIVRY
ncbi:hypothetical protein D3C75_909310 [compost metagenome]